MKPSRILAVVAVSLLVSNLSFGAAITTLSISSGFSPDRAINNFDGTTPLTSGVSGTAGDGAVIQIGYYSSATAGNNFGSGSFGSFTPLTGQGSVFGFANTTIGDTPANLSPGPFNGFFISGINIQAGINDALLPTPGTPLSIRIFNNTTIAASTRYQALSNNLWLWQAPANAPLSPTINMNLNSAGLVALSGATVATPGSTISTTISTAPEPTSAALLMVGLVSLASRRRRVAKV